MLVCISIPFFPCSDEVYIIPRFFSEIERVRVRKNGALYAMLLQENVAKVANILLVATLRYHRNDRGSSPRQGISFIHDKN